MITTIEVIREQIEDDIRKEAELGGYSDISARSYIVLESPTFWHLCNIIDDLKDRIDSLERKNEDDLYRKAFRE